ncbi:hypothetical protein BJ508DRAFT_335607 [Ascobolus immersus RN42]|uniref:Uncharacterized protein n=1 Tax=Ascobolus immersus RN42 TaxID=1160509 RepID=A0A3N4HFC7_ASCIM|nr:hypothetical protein BJ508DRAFT_335607 [Ascobolus immersus RN42]
MPQYKAQLSPSFQIIIRLLILTYITTYLRLTTTITSPLTTTITIAMDHPQFPTSITLSSGRLGCSHPRCADETFRTTSGVGLHMANVHTVPCGSGLTIQAIKSRIIDWDVVEEQRLADALEAAEKRVGQMAMIKEAGEKVMGGSKRGVRKVPKLSQRESFKRDRFIKTENMMMDIKKGVGKVAPQVCRSKTSWTSPPKTSGHVGQVASMQRYPWKVVSWE